jgi:hypothetical protein
VSSVKLTCEAARWLDQPLSSVPTKSFGWFKKRALLRGSPLKGEDVHEGPSINWFEVLCPTMIGSVRGTIFKVAVTITALRISPYTIIATVSEDISRKLQVQGTVVSDELTVWDAPDGNVVLQPIPGSVPSQVTVFVTSNIARSFT